MPITSEGLVIRRFPEVESDIQTSLTTNLNTSLVFDSDTLLGQLVSIIGAEIADKEALIQAVYDSFDIQKAEGEALDRLVALIGLTRLEAAKTSGTQTFIGADGSSIPLGTLVANPSSLAQFETGFSLDLSPANCEQVIYQVTTPLPNTTYTVEVNGNDFSYLSTGINVTSVTDNGGLAQFNHSGTDVIVGQEIVIAGYITNTDYNGTFTVTVAGSGTFEVGVSFGTDEAVGYFEPSLSLTPDIVGGLASQINLPASKTWLATNVNDELVIATANLSNITVSSITFLVPSSVTASVFAQATVTGDVRGPANSITQLVTAISGVQSTNNVLSFSTGRLVETDEELRARAGISTQLAGSSTVPANLSTIANVDGVTSVLLVENLTSTTDGEGRPPHSYEVIIQGGVDGDIAAALFSEKPAGILTHGDITVNLLDSGDTVRAVSFSRPEEIFIAVRATYSLYDEEAFPITGAADITNIILSEGNDLDIGEDVIPKRFYGPIYSGVAGINDLTVEIQTLVSQGDVPNPAGWIEDKVDVSNSQISTFSISDIYTVQI